MKIQLDTTNNTVTILEDVDLNELVYFLGNTTPRRDWKIIGYSFRVPTEDKLLWRDLTSPLSPPSTIPNNPHQVYCGDPILWCGEGTTQGVKIGLGGMGTTTKGDYVKLDGSYINLDSLKQDHNVDEVKRHGIYYVTTGTDPIDEKGNDFDVDGMKRNSIFCHTTGTARMEKGMYVGEYLKNNKDADTI